MCVSLRSFCLGCLCCVCCALMSSAQTPTPPEYLKTSFELNIGGALVDSTGDLNGIFKNAPMVGGAFAYRFHRNIQVEGGLDVAFGAARLSGSGQLSGGGTLNTTDREYFLLLGGRWVMPFKQEKYLLTGGAGAAIVNYNEVPVSVPGVRIVCSGCSSRQGAGYYTLMGFKRMINPNFGIGVTVKAIISKTEGDSLNTPLALKSNDKWGLVSLTFSFHR